MEWNRKQYVSHCNYSPKPYLKFFKLFQLTGKQSVLQCPFNKADGEFQILPLNSVNSQLIVDGTFLHDLAGNVKDQLFALDLD